MSRARRNASSPGPDDGLQAVDSGRQGAKRPLYWIDAGYWLIFYTVMGAVHALMG